MPCTLIIAEKPNASAKIAFALADTKPVKKDYRGVPCYELTHRGEKILVGCAVGHLFTLSEKDKSSHWSYPVSEISWLPSYSVSKSSLFTRKYFEALKKISKDADSFVNGCDLDREGELIFRNVLRFICRKEDAKRMRFSTLTKPDLIEAYEHASPHLDFGLAEAGETRHFLDYYWGISMSRALIQALKRAGGYKTLSTGRVQGPTLSILEKNQQEINAFVPKPFWLLQLIAGVNGETIEALHTKGRFWEKKEAQGIFDKCRDRPATVDEVKKEQYKQYPFPPFDLTSLQRDAYINFHYSPKQTLDIAQTLYSKALISYPRTSSQKLPPKIGYRKILESLKGQKAYSELCGFLLSKPKLWPREGAKEDSAHPAIFPTGNESKSLNPYQKKIYDLIVRRFLSCFADPAVRESIKALIDINGEKFKADGVRTVQENWIEFYKPYAKFKETILPEMKKGEELDVKKLEIQDKETQPPKRFTPASILKEMESENLGTKCLTGDCKIITPEWEETRLDDLWKSSAYFCHDNGVEIRRLNTPTLISFNHASANTEFIKPQLISRRKLKKNEKLLKITVKSGELKVTEDHPIYLYNKKMILKKAKEISKGDRIVSIISRNKTGKILIGENFFLQRKFKLYNNMYMHKFSSKNSLGIKKDSLPIRWSSDLAWILGYFYGDGTYNLPCYNGSHQVYFATTGEKALKLLKTRIKRVFGVEPKAYRVKNNTCYKVQCNSMMATLLAKLFPSINGKKRFHVPKKFIGDFLRGFFDADGNVHFRAKGKVIINGNENIGHGIPRVKITLAKKEHIEWIKDLLCSIGIKTNISEGKAKLNGKYFKCFTIRIGGRDRVDKFAYKVGFDVNHKKKILYKGLLCDSPQYRMLKACYDIVIALKNHEQDIGQLKNITNHYSVYVIKETMKYLVKLGILKRKRLSLPNSQVVYKLTNKDYFIHALMASYRHINSELYCSPVMKTENIKPTEPFVYDISVSKNSPNFITNGALLVHNSTRSNILQTLYDRGYIQDTSILVTQLGESVVTALDRFCPEIISVELTREFEKDMEEIQEGKKNREDTVRKSQETLKKILGKFKENELKIGRELLKGVIESEQLKNIVGKCPKCGRGDLRIIYSKTTHKRFVACNAYPKCRNTFSLPQNGNLLVLGAKCKCGLNLVSVRGKGRRPWKLCIKCGFASKFKKKATPKV